MTKTPHSVPTLLAFKSIYFYCFRLNENVWILSFTFNTEFGFKLCHENLLTSTLAIMFLTPVHQYTAGTLTKPLSPPDNLKSRLQEPNIKLLFLIRIYLHSSILLAVYFTICSKCCYTYAVPLYLRMLILVPVGSQFFLTSSLKYPFLQRFVRLE